MSKRFREEVYILTGERQGGVWLMKRRRRIVGERTAVEADWRWTMEREEKRGDVVGFYHTHPPGSGTSPSARDVRTMRAWCFCFGKELLCIIGTDRRLQATLFGGGEDTGEALPVIERFLRGFMVAMRRDPRLTKE